MISQFSSQTYYRNAKNIKYHSHPDKKNLACAKDVHPHAHLDSSKTSCFFYKQNHNVTFLFCEQSKLQCQKRHVEDAKRPNCAAAFESVPGGADKDCLRPVTPRCSTLFQLEWAFKGWPLQSWIILHPRFPEYLWWALWRQSRGALTDKAFDPTTATQSMISVSDVGGEDKTSWHFLPVSPLFCYSVKLSLHLIQQSYFILLSTMLG